MWTGLERRVDHDRRKRVSQMSRAELERELLTDHQTRLGNRRAFDEWVRLTDPKFIGLVDVDGLKWVNDNLGYAAGDALIGAVAQSLTLAGIGAFRLGGDEFAITSDNREEAWRVLGRAAKIVRRIPFEVNGRHWIGARFSFAVWNSDEPKGLEAVMKAMKKLRLELGMRADRGEPQPGMRQATRDECDCSRCATLAREEVRVTIWSD